MKPVRLGDVLRLDIDSVSVDPALEYNFAGVYSFGRGLFFRGIVGGSDTTYRRFHRLHEDMFVMSQVKGWEGALARVTKEFEGQFLSPVYPTFSSDTSQLNVRYLECFFQQQQTWQQLDRMSKGMGARRNSVYPDMLLSMEIPLPPLAEQQRIVARIDALAARIDEARRLRAQAVAEVEAVMGGARTKAYDEAARITGGVHRLNDLCVQITDGTHRTPTYVASGIPFLSVKDISSGVIKFDDCRFITVEEHANLTRRCRPEKGDVLLTKVGTTGYAKAVDIDREFSIFVSVALLKLDRRRLSDRFVEHMLNSSRLQEHSRAGTRGVGNQNLVLKFIREFPMPTPSLKQQDHIVTYLDDLQTKVNAVKRLQAETQAELDALLPSVLDRAFRGEL